MERVRFVPSWRKVTIAFASGVWWASVIRPPTEPHKFWPRADDWRQRRQTTRSSPETSPESLRAAKKTRCMAFASRSS